MTDKEILNLAQAELRAMYKRLGINGSNVLTLIDEALRQPPVMVRSEQLPCSHCGRPLKEHIKDSKLCPDRMKNT